MLQLLYYRWTSSESTFSKSFHFYKKCISKFYLIRKKYGCGRIEFNLNVILKREIFSVIFGIMQN